MDRREYHRAQLSLPVRLRWTTPFGQKTEVCETLDASRGGLRVPCSEAHTPGVALWVTFPYDVSLHDGQPEVLATVVRTADEKKNAVGGNGKTSGAERLVEGTNGSKGATLALHFQVAHTRGNGNGQPRGRERRANARRPLAVPVRVRPANIPWFEEAMTMDVSATSLRFVSNREYQLGEILLLSFDAVVAAPWTGAKDFSSRVVRIESLAPSPTLAVSVQRI